jgi:hypothetical protein
MPSRSSLGPGPRDSASFRRPAPAFEAQPRILIVCEGNKTEPLYFNALRRYRRLSATQIDIVPGGISGSDPRSIVKYARKRKKRMKRRGRRFDSVWCVFDRDEHPRIHEAFLWLRESHFDVAFSNPCFELWFLLHYQDIEEPLDRFEALRRLRRLMPEYRKTSSIFYLLIPHQKAAIQRAEELRSRLRADGRKDGDNPSTSVDRLVSFLCSLRGRTTPHDPSARNSEAGQRRGSPRHAKKIREAS